MDALELLLNRRSVARLAAPAPKGEVLDNILRAGMRVPDHGGLHPWRFTVIEGDGLTRFSHLLVQAATQLGEGAEFIEKFRQLPTRTPMIIAVVAHCSESTHIPLWEQILSAGCALHAMQMAAIAQGFSGIWKTGDATEYVLVREALMCREQDSIVGFLFLGTSQVPAATVERKAIEGVTRYF